MQSSDGGAVGEFNDEMSGGVADECVGWRSSLWLSGVTCCGLTAPWPPRGKAEWKESGEGEDLHFVSVKNNWDLGKYEDVYSSFLAFPTYLL